ncbi:MAG TPA: type II toxin-antitoxin system ParD family antitoxin [Planctomycetota bacterium]|nr:type II toxin-antitoxin system ParD family antitoxin [Planctomycetota bacterium]
METPWTTTINVSLPSTLKDFVRAQIRSGAYGSASEYIRELIRDARDRAREQDQRGGASEQDAARL